MSAASLSALYLNERGRAQFADVVDPATFFVVSANAVPVLPAPSFDDYARALGRHQARNVRRERRSFAAAGYEITGESPKRCRR